MDGVSKMVKAKRKTTKKIPRITPKFVAYGSSANVYSIKGKAYYHIPSGKGDMSKGLQKFKRAPERDFMLKKSKRRK